MHTDVICLVYPKANCIVMKKREIRKKIGTNVKLRPRPKQDCNKDVPDPRNTWTIISELDDREGLLMMNSITEHKFALYYDTMREWRDPDLLVLRSQIFLEKGGLVSVEPITEGPTAEVSAKYAWSRADMGFSSTTPLDLFDWDNASIPPHHTIEAICGIHSIESGGELSLGLRLNDTRINGDKGQNVTGGGHFGWQLDLRGVVRWWVSPSDERGIRTVRMESATGLSIELFGEEGKNVQTVNQIAIYGITNGSLVTFSGFFIST